MNKIPTNINDETLYTKIISVLKVVQLFDIVDSNNQKSAYFEYSGNIYFVHWLDGQIDVLNQIKEVDSISVIEDDLIEPDPYISGVCFSTAEIYCDGGSQPNPGEAGSGMAIYLDQQLYKLFYGLYSSMATNNIAELRGVDAAIDMAIKLIETNPSTSKVIIRLDSQYSIDCLTTWTKGWIKNNWMTASKKPVKNRELIEPTYEKLQKYREYISLVYVKAHSGIEGNEYADKLCSRAIKEKQKYLVELPITNLMNV